MESERVDREEVTARRGEPENTAYAVEHAERI